MSHVVPGVDDGAVDADTAAAMLAQLHRSGTTQLWATPHISEQDGYSGSAERLRLIDERFEQLRHALPEGLSLRLGYEVTPSAERLAREEKAARFVLDSLEVVLVDGPEDEPAEHEELILPYVAKVRAEGLRAVIAHPERHAAHPDADPGYAERLLAAGALLQVDACALLGGDGPAVEAEAWRLLADQMAALVASDAHEPSDASDLADAHRAITERLGAQLAEKLCCGIALAGLHTGAIE